MIVDALQRNPLFMSAALPLRVFPPLFNRYTGGQSFGTHVDNAIRQVTGTPHRIRTDLSATLFFTGPTSTTAASSCVEDTYGVHRVKLPAGHMVLYPATSLHHVTPVTRGARIARSSGSRAWCATTGSARCSSISTSPSSTSAAICADHPAAVQLTGVYHNLLRRGPRCRRSSFRID